MWRKLERKKEKEHNQNAYKYKSVKSSVAAPRAMLNTHALPPSSATPLTAPAPPTAIPQFLPATDFSTEPESCLAWRALPNTDPCTQWHVCHHLHQGHSFTWLPHSLLSLCHFFPSALFHLGSVPLQATLSPWTNETHYRKTHFQGSKQQEKVT